MLKYHDRSKEEGEEEEEEEEEIHSKAAIQKRLQHFHHILRSGDACASTMIPIVLIKAAITKITL